MTYHLGIATQVEREAAIAAADPADRAFAEQRVDEASAQFRAGNYDGAIRLYTEAWGRLPAPALLVYIGMTLQRLGRLDDASFRYQRYLRENSGGELESLAQQQLALVQAARESAARVAGTAPPPTPPEVPPAVMAAKRIEAPTPQQAAMRAPSPLDHPNPYVERTTYGIWIATGVGVVAIAGLGWWLVRRSKKPQANRRRRRRSR